jgi:hypothetical protein
MEKGRSGRERDPKRRGLAWVGGSLYSLGHQNKPDAHGAGFLHETETNAIWDDGNDWQRGTGRRL